MHFVHAYGPNILQVPMRQPPPDKPFHGELLDPIVGELVDRLAIRKGPNVPPGVMARQIDATHVLYLNLDGTAKRIELKGRAHSVLRDLDYEGSFELGPCEPESVEAR